MDLRQLRYLVALAEERHFTRAAARMHIAQPALSQQIRRLEDEVGLPLVHRTTRRVALTDAGELLVARARRALAEVDAAREELEDLAGVRAGRVVIGAMQSLGPYDLSVLLAEFHAAHPGVELSVREGVSDELLALLRADAVDLAFLSLAGDAPGSDLGHQRLLDEELVAILPPGHRLSRRRRIGLDELRGERYIQFREGAGLRRVVAIAARTAGFTFEPAFESNEVARIRAMVARGLGVAVLPRSDATGDALPLAVVALTRPALSRDVTLMWRAERRHSPAATAFLALARSLSDASSAA